MILYILLLFICSSSVFAAESENNGTICNCKENEYVDGNIGNFKISYKVCRFEIKFSVSSPTPYIYFGVKLTNDTGIGIQCSPDHRFGEVVEKNAYNKVMEANTYGSYLFPKQEIMCDLDTGKARILSDFYSAILYNFNSTLPIEIASTPDFSDLESGIIQVVF